MNTPTLLERHVGTVLAASEPIAKRAFAARRTHDDLELVLAYIFGDWVDDENNWDADYYDESIELYGPRVVDSEKARDVLRRAGFKCVWFHSHEYDGSRTGKCPTPQCPRTVL